MLRHALLLFAAVAAPAFAAPPEGPQRHFTGSDLFGLEWASDPQISPDGRTVAYVRRSNDVMTDRARSAIWLIDVALGTQTPLIAGAGSPRWSPDGKRLAYVAADNGGAAQLFVRWIATGTSTRVTGLPDSPGAIAWSPDGSRIAYLVRVPDESATLGKAPPKPEGAQWAPPLQVITDVTYRSDEDGYAKPGKAHIFVVSSDGGAPRQLSYGAFDDGGPLSWTPDGRSIVFSANRNADWERNPANSEVYTLDVATGGLNPLTNRAGPDAEPRISPMAARSPGSAMTTSSSAIRMPNSTSPIATAAGGVRSPPVSTARSTRRCGPAMAHCSSNMTIAPVTRSRGSTCRDASRRSPPASSAAGSTGPIRAARSRPRPAARSFTPAAPNTAPPTSVPATAAA